MSPAQWEQVGTVVPAAFATSPSGLSCHDSQEEATEEECGTFQGWRGLALLRQLSHLRVERGKGPLTAGEDVLGIRGEGTDWVPGKEHTLRAADRDLVCTEAFAASNSTPPPQGTQTLLFPNPSPTPASSDLSVLCRPRQWVAFLGSAPSLW